MILLMLLWPKQMLGINLLTLLNFSLYSIYSAQMLAITPHLTYSVLALATLASLNAFLKTEKTKFWLLAWSFAAIALATLEYGIILLLTISFSLFCKPFKQPIRISLLIQGLLVLIVCLVLVWPAGILKLKLLVSYAMYIYTALFSSYYGSASDSLLWQSKGHLINFIVVVIGSIACFFQRKTERKFYYEVFLFYGVLLLCFNLLNNFIYPQYVFSFMVILWVPAVWALVEFASKKYINKVLVYLVLIVCLLVNAFEMQQTIAVRVEENLKYRSNLKQIEAQLDKANKLLLVGYGNYIAAQNLNWRGEIVSLDFDLMSGAELLEFLKNQEVDTVVVLKNAARVLTNLTVTEVETSLQLEFEPVLLATDFKVFRKSQN
jgi:hypothetical protein